MLHQNRRKLGDRRIGISAMIVAGSVAKAASEATRGDRLFIEAVLLRANTSSTSFARGR